MTDELPRFCKDCRHFDDRLQICHDDIPLLPICTRGGRFNLVTGDPIKMFCESERFDVLGCGPTAVYWEPRAC